MTRRTLVAPTLLARALFAVVAITTSFGCDPAPEERVASLVEAAIRAHGGRERIDALEHVTITGSGRFRDRVALRSTIVHSGGHGWSVDAVTENGVRMRFGFDGDRCWREDRHIVRPCTEGDRASYAIFGEVTGARLGRGLDASRFVMEDGVTLHGEPAPALRAGELVYVFDPRTHRVVEVRHGDAVEVLHGHEHVQGVLVAKRRTMTIGAELDVEDHWEDVVASESEPAGLRAPDPPRAGATIDWEDPERLVVWTDAGALADPAQVVRSLEDFARAHDAPVSAADGIVLTALHDETDPPESARWRVAITVEAGEPRTEGDIHLERWPAQRVAGVYREGDPRTALAGAPALRSWIDARDLAAVDGARWQILAPHAALLEAADDSLSLLRIAVGERAADSANPGSMD